MNEDFYLLPKISNSRCHTHSPGGSDRTSSNLIGLATHLPELLDYVLVLDLHQDLPLRSIQRHENLRVLRASRSIGRISTILLFLWLESRVILLSPFLLHILLLFQHHPLLGINVLVDMKEEFNKIIRRFFNRKK